MHSEAAWYDDVAKAYKAMMAERENPPKPTTTTPPKAKAPSSSIGFGVPCVVDDVGAIAKALKALKEDRELNRKAIENRNKREEQSVKDGAKLPLKKFIWPRPMRGFKF